MTPEQRRARAYAARALIDDVTLQNGWRQIEDELREQWENCGSWGAWFSRRKRDRIWIELRALRLLRQKLASFAAQGRE